jgi:NAD(P)-dependent dehydrogenase (short-subunit alcohol dehydrogenase family)
MGDEAMFSLDGKVAVITGGAANLGKATAERFARAGAKVVIGDIDEAGKAIAESLGGLFIRCDVSREKDVENLLESAVRAFGRLDTVINNAGIGRGAYLPEVTEEHFDREVAVNTKGVLWGIKHAAPRIADGGAILNTASMAGVMGEMGWASYVASKAAVIGLTKTAAIELGPRGIRVNCVCPSTIEAEGGADWGELADLEAKLVPFFHQVGRLGKPEEVAALFHFLASDEAAFLSGLVLPIDGGLSAGVSLGVIEPLVGYLESQK